MHQVLKDIVDKCASFNTLEERNVTESSCDLVFPDKNRHAVSQLLSEILGTPIKQTGQAPTLNQQLLARSFGGIRTHQKMFLRCNNGQNVIAMVRPWRHGKYFTVKLALVSNEDIEKSNNPGKLPLMEHVKLFMERYT